MRRTFVAALLTLLLAPVGWATAAEVLPADAEMVYEQEKACGLSASVYRRGYDTNGDLNTREIVVYGRFTPPDGYSAPYLWAYFAPDDPTRTAFKMVLTLPGTPPEVVTIEQLEERFGSKDSCGLVLSAEQSG